MTCPEQLRRHHNKYHKLDNLAAFHGNDSFNFAWDHEGEDSMITNNVVLDKSNQVVSILESDFGRTSCICSFLSNAVQTDKVEAVKVIIGRTLWATANPTVEVVASIQKADMLQYLTIAQLVYQIGSTGRQLLCQLLNSLYNRLYKSVDTVDLFHGVPWPHNAGDYRRVFLDRHYVTSLVSSLPLPTPVYVINQDYMIPPKDFTLYALAFASSRNPDHRYSALTATNLVKACQPIQGLSCMVAFWMDDFDANLSLSKLNRNAVFGAVATMLFVNQDDNLVAAYSNLVAAGNKQDNHDALLTAMQAYFTNDNQLHYCGALDDCVMLNSHLLHCVCDQPAKRNLCGLKQGNSKLHACFGYSIHFDGLQKPFHACHRCLQSLLDHDTIPPHCDNCHAWQLPTTDTLLPYEEPMFPALDSALPNLVALNHGAGQLTIELLLATWQECWTETSVSTIKQKLDLVCVNKHHQDLFIQCWQNYTTWTNIQAGIVTNQDTIDKITERHATQPTLFDQPEPPAVWKYTQLPQWVEAPMHLQMGIVKTVARMIQKWAQDCGHGNAFTTAVQESLTALQMSSQVDKHRLVNYTPGMAGWVADNCRSLCLFMPWVYRFLATDLFTYQPYEEPDQPWETWRRVDCEAYLRARNEPLHNRKVAELKALIKIWKEQPGGPPPPVTPTACQLDGTDMLRMVWHCHRMFKALFMYRVDVSNARLCVYQFLSSVEVIDSILRTSTESPKYITTYNMISLLRAVDQAHKRHSMRYYQEGGQDGEGIVKPLRALLPSNLPPKFASNLLFNRYRQSMLNEWVHNAGGVPIWETEETTDDIEPPLLQDEAIDNGTAEIAQAFRRYQSPELVAQFLESGTPVSLVFVQKDNEPTKFGFVVQHARQAWTFYPVQAHFVRATKYQFPYFALVPPVGQNAGIQLRTNDGHMVRNIVACGYALPALLTNNELPYVYGIITDEMYHLTCAGALV